MQPKTLFTVLTEADQARGHLVAAADYADAIGAHLDVLALGVDRAQVGYYYAGASAVVMQEAITRTTEDAQAVEAAARAALDARPGLRWAVDRATCQLADLGRVVGQRARFSDLVILPKPYGDADAADLEAVVEGALFDGMGRVVVLPEGCGLSRLSRLSVAWNDSTEALAAARAALPWLSAAEQTKLVVVDPPAHSRDRSDPGGAVSEFLARHGVNVEIDVLAKSLPRISDVLLRHAQDNSIDMIVMGAYGHSRFREAILGGATRHMLEQTDRPLFLCHG